MKAIGPAALAVAAAALAALAHTPYESNMVVRAALSAAATFYPHVIHDGLELPAGAEEPNTWHGLLGGDGGGWTLAEKKAAFDWYLTTLGTNDCRSLDGERQEEIRIAVETCEAFSHTNSAPALKALALNPRGVCREDAIALTIRFMPVDDAMTEFVETIMTNSTGYSLQERGTASCRYVDRLLSFNATNEAQSNIVQRAVLMFYRNRLAASASYSIVDRLFVRNIDSYEMSSNRLEHALNALSLPNCVSPARRTFTSVTNQLLSSGQPLPWIEVGTGGN